MGGGIKGKKLGRKNGKEIRKVGRKGKKVRKKEGRKERDGYKEGRLNVYFIF